MRVSSRFGLLLLLAWLGSSSAALATPPNIVLIVSDDHGWTDYGFMGHRQVQTPRLDQLARESLTYQRGYSVTSLCSPSLATILTGLYPHQHRIANNDPPKRGLSAKELRADPLYAKQRQQMIRFMESVPTLPRLLQQKGYISFQTGKWWQGNYRTGGFTAGMSHGDPAKGGRHGDAGLEIGRTTMKPMFAFLDEAKAQQKPFLLWYAPMLPHQPHNPPEQLLKKYVNQTPSLHVAKYWAMVEWFDQTCGALLDYLEKNQQARNTIVVYITDNGWIQDPDAPKPTRSKLTHYDAGHRTPIMIRWPERVKPAMNSRDLASSIDLMPTLLKAAGVKVPEQLPGVDLLDANAVRGRKAIFGECFTHDAVDLDQPAKSLRYRWVIAGDWRLVVPHPMQEPQAKAELYNLATDPMESKPVDTAKTPLAQELMKLLDDWWKP